MHKDKGNITITDGTTVLRAVLNDTVAAKDFAKRLPFTVIGYDSGTDYCCSAASGLYDPMETQTGWKNGDIFLPTHNFRNLSSADIAAFLSFFVLLQRLSFV